MRYFILIGLLILGLHTPLQAGVVELDSGEIVQGKILLPKAIEVESEDGEKQTLDSDEIIRMELRAHKSLLPSAQKTQKLSPKELEEALDEFDELEPFETPRQTFLTWKEQARQGSIPGMVECYAGYRQTQVKKDLRKIKRKDRVKMQDSMHTMDFQLGETIFQGNQAFLEVTWNKGLYSESQVLKFTLEGEDWKIIE